MIYIIYVYIYIDRYIAQFRFQSLPLAPLKTSVTWWKESDLIISKKWVHRFPTLRVRVEAKQH